MVLIDDIVNFFMFYSFLGTGIVVLMIGRYQKLTIKFFSPFVFLSLGLVIVAFRSLFLSIPSIIGLDTTIIVPVFSILGSLLLIVGVIFLLLEKRVEKASLERRTEEIKAVLDNLRQKYFKKELSEEDMRKMNAELERELAEIEVRLKEKSQI
jgi:uncharacterized membrane protein